MHLGCADGGVLRSHMAAPPVHLRQALEDSAERPKFVETLPKIGHPM